MLGAVGVRSMEELIAQTIPARNPPLGAARARAPRCRRREALARLRDLAGKNAVFTSLIGQGYHGTILPPVIQRNILENPAWYTAYTPYQPEISQGRLEALLNYQTHDPRPDRARHRQCVAARRGDGGRRGDGARQAGRRHRSPIAFFVDRELHPQTIAVLRTRAEPLGWTLVLGDPATDLADADVFGALFQYPGTYGGIRDLREPIRKVHEQRRPRRAGGRSAGVDA